MRTAYVYVRTLLHTNFLTSAKWPDIRAFAFCCVAPIYCFPVLLQVIQYTTHLFLHLPPYVQFPLLSKHVREQLQLLSTKSWETTFSLIFVSMLPPIISRKFENRWYDILKRNHVSLYCFTSFLILTCIGLLQTFEYPTQKYTCRSSTRLCFDFSTFFDLILIIYFNLLLEGWYFSWRKV